MAVIIIEHPLCVPVSWTSWQWEGRCLKSFKGDAFGGFGTPRLPSQDLCICLHLHHLHTVKSSAYIYIICIHLHHLHTFASSAYIYIICIHLHHLHTFTSSAYICIICIHLHHLHTFTSSAYIYIICIYRILIYVPSHLYTVYTILEIHKYTL